MNDTLLFDRPALRIQREKSGRGFAGHAFLHQQAQEDIAFRLHGITRTFANALVIGAPDNTLIHHPKLQYCLFADYARSRLPDAPHSCVMDEEWLPVAAESLDCIISVLSLHHVNDLVGALVQMRRALKPDGLLLAVTVGARSLLELRTALTEAQMQISGGISPHIAPFLDVRDAGALLQRAGFHLPVVDSHLVNLSYANPTALMHELRAAGESNILCTRSRQISRTALFSQAASYYTKHFSDDGNRINATAELLTLTAWSPHPNQQQPAKRGSGVIPMIDFFDASERV